MRVHRRNSNSEAHTSQRAPRPIDSSLRHPGSLLGRTPFFFKLPCAVCRLSTLMRATWTARVFNLPSHRRASFVLEEGGGKEAITVDLFNEHKHEDFANLQVTAHPFIHRKPCFSRYSRAIRRSISLHFTKFTSANISHGATS